MSQHQIQTPTLEVDGHLVVISYISGITKVLLTPKDDRGGRDVFFDVLLTNSNVTLRVSRHADPSERPDADPAVLVEEAIEYVEKMRSWLADAVKIYRLNPV